MKKRLVFRCVPRWGVLLSITGVFVLTISFIQIFFLILAFISNNDLIFLVFSFIFLFIPLITLNIIFFKINKVTLYKILNIKKSNLIVFTTGIKINKNYLKWNKIKSISFHRGRKKKDFYYGLGLPSLQKIYILDKKGIEYNTIVDVDHFLKTNRKKNNLRKIMDLLMGLDKEDLISDWAQQP
jgi:hypothetical protein